MRVIIVGIGDIGYELTRDLTRSGSHEVVLIDSNQALCEDLSQEFDVFVLEGDGTHPELLQESVDRGERRARREHQLRRAQHCDRDVGETLWRPHDHREAQRPGPASCLPRDRRGPHHRAQHLRRCRDLGSPPWIREARFVLGHARRPSFRRARRAGRRFGPPHRPRRGGSPRAGQDPGRIGRLVAATRRKRARVWEDEGVGEPSLNPGGGALLDERSVEHPSVEALGR